MRALCYAVFLLVSSPAACPTNNKSTDQESVVPAGEYADEACRNAVQGRVAYWQREYGIRDYLIIYACSNEPADPSGAMALGRIVVDHMERRAFLWINSGRNYAEVEEVIAHELLHAVIDVIRHCNSPTVEEQHVRTLARVLVRHRVRLAPVADPITAER